MVLFGLSRRLERLEREVAALRADAAGENKSCAEQQLREALEALMAYDGSGVQEKEEAWEK